LVPQATCFTIMGAWLGTPFYGEVSELRGRVNSEGVMVVVILIVITIYMLETVIPLWPPFKDGRPTVSSWPLLVVVTGYPACLIFLLRTLKEDKGGKRFFYNWKRSSIFLGLTILYVGIFTQLGYWVSTFLYSFGLILFSYQRKGRSKARALIFSIVVSIGITVIIYVLFEEIFGVRLPGG